MSLWPIIVSSFVTFAINTFWYSPLLFGDRWMKILGIKTEDLDNMRESGIIQKYLAELSLILVNFIAIGFIMYVTDAQTVLDGIFITFIVWLSFSLTHSLRELIWENRPLNLILIKESGLLIAYIAGGAILGAW